MKVIHKLQITAICPVDNLPDVYECTITARRIIKVEDILAAVEEVKAKPAFQEEICQELHRKLACKVRLIGYHSGVETKVMCGK